MADSISTWASDESVSLNYCMEEAQLLGRGKFSVVHRTTRRSDGRPVALKRIQVCVMARCCAAVARRRTCIHLTGRCSTWARTSVTSA